MTKPFSFTVSGKFEVSEDFSPILSYDNRIVGFTTKGNEEYRLIFGIERVDANGEHIKDVTDEKELRELGFLDLEYERNDFEEIEVDPGLDKR